MVIFITLVAIIVVAFFVLSRKEKLPKSQNNRLNTGTIDDKNIKIVHVTDIHYLSPSLTDYGKSFVDTIEKSDGKMMRYIDQIMDAFVLEMIRTKPDLVIVSGDMTYNGEKESHIGLANKFKILKDKGIKVLVLPGNHDLENEMALAFEGDATRPVETVTIEEFEEIYKDYGYGKDDPDVVSRDKKSLNYVYQLGNKCHLIMVETSTKGNDQTISNSSYRWIEKWLRKAKDMNMRVIGVSHQNILAHNKLFIAGYKITNSSRLVDLYNKYNVRINLSGHMHIQHMAEHKRVHDIALACLGLDLDVVVTLEDGLLAELVHLAQAAVDEGLRLQVVAAPEDRRVAVQQLLLVELRRVPDARDLLAKLVDLVLDVAAVLLRQGVVCSLDRQLAHTLEDAVRLVQRALRRLDHADAVLAVRHRAVQTAHLGAHLLADREPCGVVRRAVDAQARGELLDGLLECVTRLGNCVKGGKCRNVVIDYQTHNRKTSL